VAPSHQTGGFRRRWPSPVESGRAFSAWSRRCWLGLTATIRKAQQTIDSSGAATILEAKGRHDPCVLPRAVPMVALALTDHLLRQQGQCSLWSVGNSPADLLVAPAGGWSRCRGQLEGDSVVVGGVTAAGALTAAMVAAALAAPNRLTAFAMRLATELPDFAVRARRAGRGAALVACAALSSSAAASPSAGAWAAGVGRLAALPLLTLLAAALEALALGAAALVDEALVADALAAAALAGAVSSAVLLAAADLPRADRTLPAGLSTAAAGLDFAAGRALAMDLAVDFAVVADEVAAALRELPGEAGLAIVWRRLLDLAAAVDLPAAVGLAAAIGLATAFGLAAAAGLTAAVVAVPRAAALARLLRPLGAAAAAERLRWESTIAHSASVRLAGLAPWASATLAAFSMSAIRFAQEAAKRLSEWDLAPLSIRVSITPAAETFLRRRLKISF
jgi:hypothetical protein